TRLAFIFIFLVHLYLCIEQDTSHNKIDFIKSDYDLEGGGTPGMRRKGRRVRRGDYYSDYDGEEEEEGEEELEHQGIGGTATGKGE
ncbi:hypothetical protein PENTCL1PPCAC_6459, partial [Pristionchus entomophagus]